MKQMKKSPWLTWLMIAALALALAGCGNNTNDGGTSPEAVVHTVVTIPASEETAEHQYTAAVSAEGKTALALLEDMAKEQNFPVVSGSGYVENIDGVAQFAQGAESGWIYLVNGKMASVGADQYVPQADDVIDWVYITSYDQLNNYESME